VELATFGQITGHFSPNEVPPFAARISTVVVTWSLLAVKVGTLIARGVCTISLQAAVHPLSGPHTTTHNKQQQQQQQQQLSVVFDGFLYPIYVIQLSHNLENLL
jgi:hypothetical protein